MPVDISQFAPPAKTEPVDIGQFAPPDVDISQFAPPAEKTAHDKTTASAAVLGIDTPGVREALHEYETTTGEKIPSSKMDAAIGGAIGGASFDFDDETRGFVNAAVAKMREKDPHAFGDYYRFFRDSARERKAQLQDEPLPTYIAGDIAGSAATSLLIPGAAELKVAKEAGLGARVGAAALRAVPQAIGMGEADLTKGEVGGAAGELGKNVAIASMLHLGGEAIGAGTTRLIKGKKLEDASLDLAKDLRGSDAWGEAEVAIKAHEGAENALLHAFVQPEFEMTALDETERAAIVAKALSKQEPEVLSEARRLQGEPTQLPVAQARDARIKAKGLVTELESPAERTALELETTNPAVEQLNKGALIARAANRTGETVDEYLGRTWLEDSMRMVTKRVGPDRLANAIAQAEDDPKALQALVGMARQVQETIDLSGNLSKTLGRSDNAINRAAGKLMDGREYYIGLEERHNIPFVDTIDSLSSKMGQLNNFRDKFDKATRLFDKDYNKAIKSGEIDPTWLARISEQEVLPDMTPTQAKILGNFKSIMDDLKQNFNMSEQEGKAFYFPRQMRDSDFIQKHLYEGVKDAEKIAGPMSEWTPASVSALLKDQKFKPIFDGITYLRGGEVGRPKSVQELQSAIRELLDSRSLESTIQANTRAVNQRLSDTMPLWLRETNASSAVRKYVDSTGKYKFLMDDISKLEGMSEILSKRGDELGARYIRDHLQDLKGGSREGTVANFITSAEKGLVSLANKKAIDSTNAIQRATWEGVAELPSSIHAAMQNMYPVFLGARVDAPLRNMYGAASQLYGEIGDASYTAKLMTRANFRLFASKGAMEELRSKGILNPERTQEYMDIIKRTYGKSPTRQSMAHATDWVNNKAMTLFTLSENLNRAVSHFMAEGIASDLSSAFAKAGKGLTSDEVAATKYFNNSVSQLDRRAVGKMLEAGDLEGAKTLTSRRLVAKTQFNYNPANASAFAREAGPYLSMFTKWPTAVGGDMANIILNKNSPVALRARKVMQKYVAPLMVAATVGQMLPGEKEVSNGLPANEQLRGKDTVGQRALGYAIGKGDLTSYAPTTSPLQAVASMNPVEVKYHEGYGYGLAPRRNTSGGLGSSPVWETAKAVTAAALKQADIHDKAVGVAKAAAPLIPMGVLFKFAYDMNAIANGDPLSP